MAGAKDQAVVERFAKLPVAHFTHVPCWGARALAIYFATVLINQI